MLKDSTRYYLINDTLNVNLIVLITIKMFIYLQFLKFKKKRNLATECVCSPFRNNLILLL